jgi:hypothetical protein
MEIGHSSQYYKSKLKELNVEFTVNLNELRNAYTYNKTYPDLSQYKKRFENDQSSMDNTRTEFFLLKDSLQQDIANINKIGKQFIKKINKIELDNEKLFLKLKNIENDNQGAIGMYNDSQEEYNFQLIQNWIIAISFFSMGYLAYKNNK